MKTPSERERVSRTHDLFGRSGGAKFSACGRYRYRLWLKWGVSRPTLAFLMLNPSIAESEAFGNA